jgi:sulfite exporter TauE/SafE/copper chaperone CopZ
MEKYTIHVSGMYCKACVGLIEMELTDFPQVTQAKASLKHHHVEVTGNFGGKSLADIISDLEPCLKKHGYSLSVEKPQRRVAWQEFWIAVPVAAVFIVLFVWLQKAGLVNFVSTEGMGYPTVLLIGLIASVSTCMAVVGGLTLSVTANFAKEGDKIKPQLLFHAGRLGAFFLLGGIIGMLGAGFEPGPMGLFLMNTVLGIIMLLLGVNLLDVLPSLKRFQLTLPAVFSRRLLGIKQLNHTLMPAILGGVTFFLPCGFTQSMQFYALSTGHFLTGAMTMLVFALGTLPVLVLLSFASLGIHSKKASGIFFKTAGLVVIALALFNLMNALVVAGIIHPFMGIL